MIDLSLLAREYRKEVQDKLFVFASADRSSIPVHKAIVQKQCEDFLVEQFEAGLLVVLQDQQAQIAFAEADRIVEVLEEPDWVARCKAAEASLLALTMRLEAAKQAAQGFGFSSADTEDDLAKVVLCLGNTLYEREAQIVALAPMNGWRPMETAPKHGRKFIAYSPREGLLFTMHWHKSEKMFMTDYERWSGVFTHWQPIPSPPSETP